MEKYINNQEELAARVLEIHQNYGTEHDHDAQIEAAAESLRQLLDCVKDTNVLYIYAGIVDLPMLREILDREEKVNVVVGCSRSISRNLPDFDPSHLDAIIDSDSQSGSIEILIARRDPELERLKGPDLFPELLKKYRKNHPEKLSTADTDRTSLLRKKYSRREMRMAQAEPQSQLTRQAQPQTQAAQWPQQQPQNLQPTVWPQQTSDLQPTVWPQQTMLPQLTEWQYPQPSLNLQPTQWQYPQPAQIPPQQSLQSQQSQMPQTQPPQQARQSREVQEEQKGQKEQPRPQWWLL